MSIPVSSVISIGRPAQEVFIIAGIHFVSDILTYDTKTERRIEDAIERLKQERAMDAWYWGRLLFRCMSIVYKVQCPDFAAPFAPAHLICPLTLELFSDPVCTPSGNTFERSAIVDFAKRFRVDPFTRAPLTEDQLYPNTHMRDAVRYYLVTALKYPF